MSPSIDLTHVLLAGIGTYLVSLALTPLVRRVAVRLGCVARPSNDRWGRRVISRLGGLPIAIGFLLTVGWTLGSDHRMGGLLAGGLLMLGMGLLDDFRRLHPYTKLVMQILAACLVILASTPAEMWVAWLTIPLTVGWLVLTMNAFNLMDNMDGLSAGIGAIAAGFSCWHALQGGEGIVAVISASLCGATLGFLRYNLPPAKIFMGDTGSQVLGLGMGAVALMGVGHQARLLGILALPTLLLAVPIFDTLFVTLQRVSHGRHPFQGGQDHLSHRLVILGLTPRQVVYALYALSALFGVLSIALSSQSPLAIAGVWLLVVVVLVSIGVYLARVRVYAGEASPEPAGAGVTLVETMLVHKGRILEVVIDFLLICACYVTAHALRFEGTITPDIELLILKSLPWIIGVKMVCFFSCGLYRGVWRYTSLSEMIGIFRAITLSSILSALTLLYLWRFEGYSRAVFIIDGLLLFVAVSGARLAERLLNEWIASSVERTIPILIVGAGDTGELVLRHLRLDPERPYRVVGFLDEDRSLWGGRIHGVPVFGSWSELDRLIEQHRIREILVTLPQCPPDLLQLVQVCCQEHGIRWRMVPSLASDDSLLSPGP